MIWGDRGCLEVFFVCFVNTGMKQSFGLRGRRLEKEGTLVAQGIVLG